MAEVVLASVLDVLKDALRLQGSRGLDLKRATSGDTPLYQVPELKLNICMVSEVFVQILATGFGALAFVWATVVLLGGFSTLIPRADFWVITAIVFIQTARVVGLNASPEAEFFNQVPPAFLVLGSEHYTTWWRRSRSTGQATGGNIFSYILMLIFSFEGWVLIMMALLAILVLAVQFVAGTVCISLSIYRLVALSRHHDNSYVFHALILLYALVLLQGGLFIIWLRLRLYRSDLADRVNFKYGLEDKRELVDKYMDKTLSTAMRNGLSSTINRNLASFAADLMKSDYSHDHIDAFLIIHTLTSQEDHRTRTLSKIQSSPLCVSRLLDMVTSKSPTDQKTKIYIGEIVTRLASSLRLTDISGATESISSMIGPYLTKISTPDTNENIDHQTDIDITIDQQGTIQSASGINGAKNNRLCISVKQLKEKVLPRLKKFIAELNTKRQQGSLQSSSSTSVAETKPLIIHGLLILAKLAVNPDNCKQIYESKGLFSKIISPVKNKLYEIPGDDGIAMEITEKALEVVSMLVSGRDEINGKIRHDICSNGIAVNDIRPILEKLDHKYNKLKVPVTKILTELYFDMSTRATIGLDDIAVSIDFLKKIFFGDANDSGLRKAAVEALAGLAMDNVNCTRIMNLITGRTTSVVQLLTDMIFAENSRLYQTSIAQLLMQICANSDSNATGEILRSLKLNLHEVLRVICNVEQAANANQAGSQQSKPGQPPLVARSLHLLYSVLVPRHSHAANRNTPGDKKAVVPQSVGDRRKSLAAFLGLFMKIFEKLSISADEFDAARKGIPLHMDQFVGKLNDIIEQCMGYPVDSLERKAPSDYLIIFKTVTKLCAWMMQSKPDYITEFQNKNTSTKLQGALEDMRGLELGMLLMGSAGDMTNYEALSTIVGAARKKMDANVQRRSA